MWWKALVGLVWRPQWNSTCPKAHLSQTVVEGGGKIGYGNKTSFVTDSEKKGEILCYKQLVYMYI